MNRVNFGIPTFYVLTGSVIAGLVFMVYMMIASVGTPFHDEIGHFLISRDAWVLPELIFDVWGRTVHTLLYMVPALFGLTGVRLFSLLLALLTVYITTDLAKLLGIKYWYFIPFYLFFQPWFARIHFLAITEVPFSIIMVAAIWLYLKDRRNLATFLVGLLPLIRYEGIALVVLWVAFLLYRRHWAACLWVVIPSLVYNIADFVLYGEIPFAVFLDPEPNNIYGSGPWYHFLIRLPHPQAVGIPMILLAAAGLRRLFQSTRLLVIAGWYVSYLILHSVIFALGLFASGGYKFFLLPMAPAFATLATLGLQESTQWLKKYVNRKNIRYAVGLICGICIAWTLFFVQPHPYRLDDIAVQKASNWIQRHNLADRYLASTNVYFYYFLPMRIDAETLWEEFPPLDEMPAGSIVVWDGYYSDRWGLDKSYMMAQDNWKLQASYHDGFCLIFEKTN